jgi:hypothetical protein
LQAGTDRVWRLGAEEGDQFAPLPLGQTGKRLRVSDPTGPRSWLSGCKPAFMSFSIQDVSPIGAPRKKVSANSGKRFWEVVKPEARCLYVPPWR